MEHEVCRFWMTKLDAGLMTSLPASDPGSAAVWGSKRINPRPQSCLCLTWSGCPSNDDDDDLANVGERQFSISRNVGKMMGVQCWPRVECTKITFSGNIDKLRFASV